MKYCHRILYLFAFVSLLTSFSFAQVPGDSDRPRGERLERFRKMRLMEVLKLDEETAVRFFAKQTAHEEKTHQLMNSRNDALDMIDSIIHNKRDPKELEKPLNQVLDIDQKIFQERERFQNEIRGLLTLAQFGKYLVFERNFGREVREAVQGMHQDRRGGPGN